MFSTKTALKKNKAMLLVQSQVDIVYFANTLVNIQRNLSIEDEFFHFLNQTLINLFFLFYPTLAKTLKNSTGNVSHKEKINCNSIETCLHSSRFSCRFKLLPYSRTLIIYFKT